MTDLRKIHPPDEYDFVRLTQPSRMWQLMMIIGLHQRFETGYEDHVDDTKTKPDEPGGILAILAFIWRVLNWIIGFLYRWAFAIAQGRNEGAWLDVREEEVIVRNFNEPNDLIDLVLIALGIGGRVWFDEASLPAVDVNSASSKANFLGWTNLTLISSHGAKNTLPTVTVKNDVKNIIPIIKAYAVDFEASEVLSTRQKRAKNAALDEIEKEKWLEKLRDRYKSPSSGYGDSDATAMQEAVEKLAKSRKE